LGSGGRRNFGRQKAIIEYCEQVGNFFKSGTTKFETLNVIKKTEK
jgi:hypothetical protein